MAREPRKPKKTENPDVVLDVSLRERVLYLVISNRRDHPVRDVRVTFRRELAGLGGEVLISDLPLWTHLDYMAPGRIIEVPLDRVEVYFAREKNTKITATVAYKDPEGTRFQAVINHDLAAYRNFPELVVR